MKRKDTTFEWAENGSINNLSQPAQEIGYIPNTQANADDVNFKLNDLDQYSNSVNDELFNLLDEAGIVPDENDNTQVAQAVNQISNNSIFLPINDTIYYGGEFDASTQFTTVNSPTYDYADYSYTLNGTNQYLIGSYGSVDLSANDFNFYFSHKRNSLGTIQGVVGHRSDTIEVFDVVFLADNTIAVALSSNGTSFDISNFTTGAKIYNDTVNRYDFRLWHDLDNTAWKLDYSQDGKDIDDVTKSWTNDVTVVTALTLFNPTVSREFLMGVSDYAVDDYFNGVIYLENTSFYVDGTQVVRPQDTSYTPNTIAWKGKARSDDNTTNIISNIYILSPVLGGSISTTYYLFVGFDNNIDKNVILEWDTDVDGTNLVNITGVKRRVLKERTNGSGNLIESAYVSLKSGAMYTKIKSPIRKNGTANVGTYFDAFSVPDGKLLVEGRIVAQTGSTGNDILSAGFGETYLNIDSDTYDVRSAGGFTSHVTAQKYIDCYNGNFKYVVISASTTRNMYFLTIGYIDERND